MVFLPGKDEVVCEKSVCDVCVQTKHYLRTKKFRLNKGPPEKTNETDPQHRTFAYMSREELLNITRKQSGKLRKLHKQIERLEKHREKMSTVGEKTDVDFKFMPSPCISWIISAENIRLLRYQFSCVSLLDALVPSLRIIACQKRITTEAKNDVMQNDGSAE